MAWFNRVARIAVITTAISTTVAVAATAVYASGKGVAAPADLKTVINNLRTWLIGLLL